MSPSRRAVDVTLRGMRFHARVGVLPHEREVPQPIEIDLTVTVAAGEDVLDYRRLYDDVAAVIGQEPLDYLEQIAENVTERVLSHARVTRAAVRVRKPHVALPGPLAGAEVSITRARDAR